MAKAKNITMFLIDGDINGLIKSSISGRTDVLYKVPRTQIEKFKNRPEATHSGVYILFGESAKTGKPLAYIGQAGTRKNGSGIITRLMEHARNPKEDFWNEAIVFTDNPNTFGPTEIYYLENRFYNMAVEANRYEIKNGNDPNPGNITEEKESELEDHIENARIIIGALGHKIFEPYIKKESSENNALNSSGTSNQILYLKRSVKEYDFTVNAMGKQTDEGFVVLKGSVISPQDNKDVPATIKEKRKTANINRNNVLQEDVLFTSPSSAAVFVIGKSANGWTSWQTENGKNLHDLNK